MLQKNKYDPIVTLLSILVDLCTSVSYDGAAPLGQKSFGRLTFGQLGIKDTFRSVKYQANIIFD